MTEQKHISIFKRFFLKLKIEFSWKIKPNGTMPFLRWTLTGLGNAVISFFLWLWDIIKSVGKAFLNIFIYTYKGILWIGKAIGRLCKRYFIIMKEGTWKTRLSFFIMGSGAFFNGQRIKGLLYFILQAGYGVFMGFVGWHYVYMLGTLGTKVFSPAWYDSVNDIWYPATTGDNSMLLLLFGVATVMLTIAFLLAYNMNIKNARENQMLMAAGKKPHTFKEDVHAFVNEKFHISVLSLPTLTVFAFTILPLIFMILIAFTNFDGDHQPPGKLFTWVGLTNFMNLFAGTNAYYALLPKTLGKILGWTIVWAIFATFLNYIFGMILALMINKKGIKLKKVWRTIFVITIAVPQFISLLVMSRLLDNGGPIVYLLQQWGWVSNSFSFLSLDGLTARITVIVVNLWVGVPYTMLITSGILMNIPEDLYESARIDGAGAAAQFFKITLPYMLFVTGPYLVTQFIGNMNNFNVIYFLTGGGPSSLSYFQAGQTDLLVTWLYKLTVNESEYAVGSTIGIMIFLISSFASLIMYSKTGAVQKEDEFQ